MALLRSVELAEDAPTSGYPWDLPAVRFLATVDFDQPVTFLVGDNGTGKSTLIEAIAVAAGFNAEGGSHNVDFATRRTESALCTRVTLAWTTRPSHGWFLRAESFYNLATYVEDNVADYFEGSFHERSHGESFLDLAMARFRPGGFYLLDEPESALSFQGCLRLLRVIHDCVTGGAQFVVATHSPLLLALEEATIYELNPAGIDRRAYDNLELVLLWRDFLKAPDRFLHHLLGDDAD